MRARPAFVVCRGRAADSATVREGGPVIFTNCKTGEGIDAVLDWLDDAVRQTPVTVAGSDTRE